jgi:hypothetical protein
MYFYVYKITKNREIEQRNLKGTVEKLHLIQKKTVKKEQRSKKDETYRKKSKKMTTINPTIPIITLNVNGLKCN